MKRGIFGRVVARERGAEVESRVGIARDFIFESITQELERGPLKPAARSVLAERISKPPALPRPALPGEPVGLFIERFTRRGGSVQRLADIADVPSAVQQYIDQQCLPPRLAMSAPLTALGWPARLAVHTGAARSEEVLAVSLARLGVVETGSVLLGSGVDTPTTHNFVPDHHIVVLYRRDMVMHLEDAWARLRAQGALPRALNFIAGPSRTGDIEQTIQLGAHGPRRLHVLLVG